MVCFRDPICFATIDLLLIKCKNVYHYYICWTVPVISYAIILLLYGTIPNVNFESSLLRGIAGLMLGSAAYYFVPFVKSAHPIGKKKPVLG